ncbi:SUR7 protein [Phlyctema vagabunda]|uniref:SUR7 protein n=1 Tax=Phlyctema vagabunda TaxID=108571 RepID=A0ABR4P9I4_9HELO
MAAGIRSIAGLTSIILIGASIVLLFFVVLSGYTDMTPFNKTYFLRADTSSFTPAGRTVSQWTYFYVCGEGNQDCGSPVPALPLGYAWLGRETGVPDALLGSHGKGTTSTYYYYMWRFGWVFYLIALVFASFGFLASLLAPFSRLASGFSGLILGTALFFMSLAAALMTVTFVKMRNVFQKQDITARLGRYAFGFTWGAWAAMFLAMVLLFLGCGLGGSRKDKVSSDTSFFRRQRSRKSARGSFIDNDSAPRVKEEYA